MKLRVQVTEADIESGDCSTSHCAAALALKRALVDAGLAPNVSFVPGGALFINRKRCHAPPEMRDFGRAFDTWNNRGRLGTAPSPPPPFEVEVQLP